MQTPRKELYSIQKGKQIFVLTLHWTTWVEVETMIE